MGTQVRYVFLTHLAVAWYGTRVYKLITAPGSLTSDVCSYNRPVYCQRNWNSCAVDLRPVQSYEMEAFLFIYFHDIASHTNRQRTMHASSSVHDQRNQQVPAVTHTNIDYIQMRLAQEKPPIGQRLSNRKFRKQTRPLETTDAVRTAPLLLFTGLYFSCKLVPTPSLAFSCVRTT